MPSAILVEQLEVIGYADPRQSGMLPSIVPPIFRFREQPGRILVPPFSLSAGFLCGASEVDHLEIQELRDAGDVVLFGDQFGAETDYELWIDESHIHHYEARTTARRHLQNVAVQSIQQAKAAFRDGRLAESERFCSAAISADDKFIDAFVLKAAIRRRQQDLEGAWLMARLISPYLNELSFERLVDGYTASNQTSRTTPEVPLRSPMRDVATYAA
jgi:hypothetical protein